MNSTDEKFNKKNGVLILGVERSGTSMTANIISEWGANGGHLKHADDNNAKGYFENVGAESVIAGVIDDILESEGPGVGWEFEFSGCLSKASRKPKIQKAMAQALDSISSSDEIWFWKTPFLSISIPFWERFIARPVLVVTIRNPFDTVMSMIKFNEFPDVAVAKDVLLLYWQHYLVKILEDTQSFEQKLFVSYEVIIQNPRGESARINSFLNDAFSVTQQADGVLNKMSTVATTRLRNNNSDLDFSERNEPTETQKQLYKILKNLTDTQMLPDGFRIQDFYLTEAEKLKLNLLDVTVLF